MWENFEANRLQQAPPTDKPKLTLKSIDVVDYGLNRALRVRFKSEEARGALSWTVLGMFTTSDTVVLAHLGTPEDGEEGIDGFEALAKSFRFN